METHPSYADEPGCHNNKEEVMEFYRDIKIDPTTVKKIYSGKPGCMCGCRGIYRYPETTSLEDIKTETGYNPDPKSINGRMVKKVIDLVQRSLDENAISSIDNCETYLYVEIASRAYCIYFKGDKS
jgi:hypothetical protein